ncbi:MAG: hypothetical protein ACRD0J_05205 [Acidimicrobiales bacterium]
MGRALWPEWLAGVHELQPSPEAGRVLDHLVDQGLLFDEAGMLSVGPGAEQSYGRKHFLALTSVFTSEPLVEVRAGMDEVGHVHPISLRPVGGAAPTLSLGGRGWLVEHVDWRRRVVWVRAVPAAGRSVWSGSPRGLSSRHAGAIRDVVAGADPGADLSRRATSALEEARSALGFARLGETALVTGRERDRWWTFAGLLANAELAARVWGSSSAGGNVTSLSLEVPRGMAPAELVGLAGVPSGPSDMAEELAGNLKFGDCLPADLAAAVATARAHDEEGLARCLSEPVIVAPDTEPLTTR